MIQCSVCILTHPGSSANLKWELEYVRRENLHQKLFILTRPEPRRSRLERWSNEMYFRLCGKWPVPWYDYAAMLQEAAYKVSDDDPGAGEVIGFDENAASIVLAENADLPSEFIQAVADRLGHVAAITLRPPSPEAASSPASGQGTEHPSPSNSASAHP